MKENWDRVAKFLGFTDEKSMWETFYVKYEMSASKIGKKLGCTQVTVTNRLRKFAIPARPRGGANNLCIVSRKLHLMDQRFVLNAHPQKVADRANCSYAVVYKYKTKVRSIRGVNIQPIETEVAFDSVQREAL